MQRYTEQSISGSNHLVTVSEVADYLDDRLETSLSSTLSSYIGYVSTTFDNYCKKKLALHTWLGYYDGTGCDEMLLANYPIVSVNSLQYRLTPEADYQDLFLNQTEFNKHCIIYFDHLQLYMHLFHPGFKSIKIEYVAGYSVIPDDIKKATIEAVIEMYKESFKGGGRIGIKSRNVGTVASESFTYYSLSDRHKDILDFYRKPII